MPVQHKLDGIYSPVLTPFKADLSPDLDAFIFHCGWLLDSGVGLAVFGTNSEANSLSVAERRMLLDALLEAGLPAVRMMPGTGCCSLSDTVELTRHATLAGVGGVLMLPPFYYKGVSEDGLFRHYAEVIERVADDRLRIYLYHIPPVAQVPITFGLIERLLKAYPSAIAGIKDSSGDWGNTEGMLREFQPVGFDVFAGSELFLLRTLRGGGAGCITATGNVNPAPMVALFKSWRDADADRQQAALDVTRAAFQKFPLIAAMKAAVAEYGGMPSLGTVRPPLVGLEPHDKQALLASLTTLRLRMPGFERLHDALAGSHVGHT
ncbi:MAG TPA: dihydrodipicolinate synthase family protein [Ramlibacter sp.]|uniref:dihydrodipicolinate synthase family protein n=1 Tax=Ramlibacter sp. TaxID=1917967 RepID=UPI002C06C90E|nr:dihydrodipicolinate synthase family protein [Ramlibacter sp.]HVZ44245.1 dihydrodipicolinate synthase family protein [Ramlibacter sp.]